MLNVTAYFIRLVWIMGLSFSPPLATPFSHKNQKRWAVPSSSLQMTEPSSLPTPSSTPSSCSTTTTQKMKRLFPFTEARKLARGHGFQSHEEFVEYSCPGAYQIPKNADQIWHADWTSWEDFLGIPWTFQEGRIIARQLNLKSAQEYLELMESKTISDDQPASRLPYRPDLLYKEEWQGWDDWLYGS